MEVWIGLPRWVRVAIASPLLIWSAFLLAGGVVWPWGWAVGGTLLVLAFPKPLGPRPVRTRPRRRDATQAQDML